ncbi:hypothetical protein PanWU01x14_295940 [Parasponia andersonii]|uniref:Uncharacterized protein n=1 Tax=Parasponia andersonii TaxID=3476 RepID=A0A2P5AVI9_PARAD|nr:hypothetical protein PanWU01x14_295940 [Parasponia andersonii]
MDNTRMQSHRELIWLEANQNPLKQLAQVNFLEIIAHCFKACIAEAIFWGHMDGRDCIPFDRVHGVAAWLKLKVTYFRLWENLPDTRILSHPSSRTCLGFIEDRCSFPIQIGHTHL